MNVAAPPVRPAPAEVLVVTGMSGAGRTSVAKVLEDLDYFVIDNLPPILFERVLDLAVGPGNEFARLALVADVRGGEFFDQLSDAIATLRDAKVSVRVLFLEASDKALVTRFETTRRRHPADEHGEGVLKGIAAERSRLADLRGAADLIFDTTNSNVHELRDRVIRELGKPGDAALRIKVLSFGFKHGAPREADLMMDVRFLPNPHWIEHLRPHTGKDAPVRDYVLGNAVTREFLDRFKSLLDTVVPGYVAEGKRYLTIAIGCTGGKHRSVAISDEVAAHLTRTAGVPVQTDHRDLGAE